MLGKGVLPGWVPSLTGNPRLTSWSENFLLAPSALSIPKGSLTTTVPGEQAEKAGRGLLLVGLGAGLQMVPLTLLPLLSLSCPWWGRHWGVCTYRGTCQV